MACGKAFLAGTEGLGENAGWFEKTAAWASEVLPFASDLRTLGFEIYKGMTGCDRVSKPNVAFAFTGLVIDTLTLGAGKAITGPMKVGLIAGRSILKRLATDVAIGVTVSAGFDFAITAYVKKLSQDAAREDGDPDYTQYSEEFLQMLEMKATSGNISEADEVMFAMITSASDAIDLSKVHCDSLQSGGLPAIVDEIVTEP